MHARSALGAAFLIGLAPLGLAAPQDIQTIAQEGDAVPGVGLITLISNLAVNDSGSTLVEVDTDNADTDTDSATLRDGVLDLREGQSLPLPAGALLDSFDSINLNAAGDSAYNFFLDGTGGSSDDSGIYYNTTLVIQEGNVSGAPQFTAGTPYTGFFEVKMNASNQMLAVASLDDPNITSTTDRGLMRIDVDGAGAILSENAYLKEGDVAPGTTETITDFGTGPHEFAINDSGSILYAVDLTGDTSMNAAIYQDMTLLAREGGASPVGGRNWSTLTSTELDLSNSGEYVYSGSLDGDSASNLLLVKNGAKFRQEGDSLPAIGGISVFTSFGSGPLWINDMGEVLWYGDWDDANTDVDTGLFLDDELLVQEGVTMIGGLLVDSLSGVQDGYAMSRNGRYILFEATLEGGINGAYLIERGLGEVYCVGAPNSVGPGASIGAMGSVSVAAMDLTLSATGLPGNVPGLFFFGPSQIQVPFGDGFRCVGGATSRVQPVTFADGAGVVTRPIDFNAGYASGLVPGADLNFQCWYRDAMAGMSGFNLSDGLRLVFQ